MTRRLLRRIIDIAATVLATGIIVAVDIVVMARGIGRSILLGIELHQIHVQRQTRARLRGCGRRWALREQPGVARPLVVGARARVDLVMVAMAEFHENRGIRGSDRADREVPGIRTAVEAIRSVAPQAPIRIR